MYTSFRAFRAKNKDIQSNSYNTDFCLAIYYLVIRETQKNILYLLYINSKYFLNNQKLFLIEFRFN